MEVYIFAADLYCEDCGARIIAWCEKHGKEKTEDSDSYPQGPYSDGGGEADTPQFCGAGADCINALTVDGLNIGMPLDNPLTRYGAEYLRTECVTDDTPATNSYRAALNKVYCEHWSDYLGV
jgi:hypothetical protein